MTRLGHLALAAALAWTAGAAAGASAASTLIVPGRSIGPIALGDERYTVETRYGPGRILRRTPTVPRNPNLDVVLVRYDSLAVTVRFPSDEASLEARRIVTGWSAYRTARGIGVGSTRAALLRAYPRAACRPVLCRVGPRIPERQITRFWLAGGRVRLVEVVMLGPEIP